MLGLRYRDDLRTLGLIAAYFVLSITRWNQATGFAATHPTYNRLWIACIAFFSFVGATITHNCVHVPMFKKTRNGDWLNKAWNCVLTNTYGHPVSTLIPGHNLSHHKHTQGPKDVMRTTKVVFGWSIYANVVLCLNT